MDRRGPVDVYFSTGHVVRNTDGSQHKTGESARLYPSTSTQQRDGCSVDLFILIHRRRLRTLLGTVLLRKLDRNASGRTIIKEETIDHRSAVIVFDLRSDEITR